MTRVAVDLLGGDAGPDVVSEGICSFLSGGMTPPSTAHVVLVGPRDVAETARERCAVAALDPTQVSVMEASRAVPMSATTSEVLGDIRTEPRVTSIVGMDAIKSGQVDAFVSMGHTGATVASAVLSLGRIPGMGKPGLAVELPSRTGPVVLTDAGASPQVTATDMTCFAAAGLAYAESLGVRAPRVGLLSVGAERGKGDMLRREADRQLEEVFGGTYAGPVEAHDLLGGGRADVVVVDGFTGNVTLKAMEGALLWSVAAMGRVYGTEGPAREVLRTSHHLSGGVLLGVLGVVVVGHGASSPAEVAACIARAERTHVTGVVSDIQRSMESLGKMAVMDESTIDRD